jgi:hypothetical protein
MHASAFGLPIQANPTALVGASSGTIVSAKVAMDSAGDFVEVWSAPAAAANTYDIFARLYDAFGNARGGAIQVNDPSQPATSYGPPAIATAMDAAGDFVVAWDNPVFNPVTNLTTNLVEARTFNALGQDTRGQFDVSTSGSLQSVAMDAAGDFVVVWTGAMPSSNSSTSLGIQEQLYAADRTPLKSFTVATTSSSFTANSFTSTSVWNVQAAMNARGDFVVGYRMSTLTVTYQTNGLGYLLSPSFSSASQLMAQEYDSQGTAGQLVTLASSVSSYTPFVLGIDGQDRLIAVSQAASSGLSGQRFDAAGNALGSPFQVNTDGQTAISPALAVADSGAFAVAWVGFVMGPSSMSSSLCPSSCSVPVLYARRFDVNGTGEPQQLQVQSLSQYSGSFSNPSLAFNAAGGLVVGWSTAQIIPSPNATPLMSGSYIYYSSYTSLSNIYASLLGSTTPSSPSNLVRSLAISTPTGTTSSSESTPSQPSSPVLAGPTSSGSFSPIDSLAQQLAVILARGTQPAGPGTSGQAPALPRELAPITPPPATNAPSTPVLVATDGGSPEQPTLIAGKVFLDYNGNGIADEGEPGVAGQIVYLESKNDGRFEPEKRFAITDEKGEYQFRDLRPGIYEVRQVQRTFLRQTSPPGNAGREVSLSKGRRMVLDQDFGALIIRTRKSRPVVVEDAPKGAEEKVLDGGGLELESRLDKPEMKDETLEGGQPSLLGGWMTAAAGVVLWRRPNRSKKSLVHPRR